MNYSIFKDGNNYRGQVLLGTDWDGKRKYKKFRGSTKKEVKSKIDEFVKSAQLDSNNVDFAYTVLFNEYTEHWLNDIVKPTLKAKSYDTTRFIYEQYIKKPMQNKRMVSLTYIDIQNIIDHYAKLGYSYSTVHRIFITIQSSIKRFLLQFYLNIRNPCEGVKLPKNVKKPTVYYQEDDVKKICAEATRTFSNGTNCYRLGWAIVLLIYTGMRKGELFALTWEDIDFKKGTIRINKNCVEVKGEIINQDTPKTQSSNRIIPIINKSREALKHLYQLNKNFKYVVSTANGTQVRQYNFDRMFRDICGAVNVEKHGVHSLRHTFASMLFKNGCDVQIISKLLGHSCVNITRDIYIHVTEEQKQEEIVKLDSYLV